MNWWPVVLERAWELTGAVKPRQVGEVATALRAVCPDAVVPTNLGQFEAASGGTATAMGETWQTSSLGRRALVGMS